MALGCVIYLRHAFRQTGIYTYVIYQTLFEKNLNNNYLMSQPINWQ